MKKVIGIMSTLAAGVVIGAAIGLLFAPEEGKETRKKIMKGGRKLVGMVDDHIEDGKETLEELQAMLQKQLKRVNDRLGKIG